MRKKTQANFIRETCIAGAVIDVNIKFSSRNRPTTRAPKSNPSREAVVKYNDRLATKKLTRLMNSNFNPGDWHITLTYEEIAAQEEAAQEMKNFKRRLARKYKAEGKELKYIEVTEYDNHRIHHHMVVNYIDPTVIEQEWKRGHVRFSALDRKRNYKDLAEYFVKETSKTMRKDDCMTKKHWSASRNLTRPIIKREIVDASALYEKPRALKGYEIEIDSIRTYEHPYTGIQHLEYMMISTDPVPRIKTWRKGNVVHRDETFKRAQEIQIDMSSLDGWCFV